MTLNSVLFPILVHNLEKCTFCRYISIFTASTHSKNQHHNLRTPFGDTPFISLTRSKHLNTEIYRGLAYTGEGDSYSDLN